MVERSLTGRCVGEYGLYFQGKYFACVCDNQLFVKVTQAGKDLLGAVQLAPRIPARLLCLLVTQLEGPELLFRLTEATCRDAGAQGEKESPGRKMKVEYEKGTVGFPPCL